MIAPIYFRLLISDEELDTGFVERLSERDLSPNVFASVAAGCGGAK